MHPAVMASRRLETRNERQSVAVELSPFGQSGSNKYTLPRFLAIGDNERRFVRG